MKLMSFNAPLSEKLEQLPEQHELPILLSLEDLCNYLGLGKTKVREMILTGEIPHTRARNRIRVYASDVKEYLEKRKIQAKK